MRYKQILFISQMVRFVRPLKDIFPKLLWKRFLTLNVTTWTMDHGTFLQFSPQELHTFVKVQSADNIRDLVKTPSTKLGFCITLRSYNSKAYHAVDYRSRDPMESLSSHGVLGHPLNASDHRTPHTIRSRAIEFVRSLHSEETMTLGKYIGIPQLSYFKGEPFANGPYYDWRTDHLDGNRINFFCDLDNEKAYCKPMWSEEKQQLTFTSSFVEV